VAPYLAAGREARDLLASCSSPTAVVVDTPAILPALRVAWQALQAGASSVDPLLGDMRPQLPQLSRHLQAELAWPTANADTAHLAALIALGTPAAEIAERLNLSVQAVYDRRYRLRQRAGVADDQVQAWAQAWLLRALATSNWAPTTDRYSGEQIY
jgi:DNA-binding NarL/FixJ family response regulator